MSLMTMAANAQLNYTIQTACHPDDVKHYDTERLRGAFLMEKVMSPDEINLTYTLYDRLIYGGVMPVNQTLVLETFDELKAEHFLDRRELGVINVGGDGVVTVDGKEYPIVRCYMGKEIAAPEASVELNSSMRPRVMWEAVTGATRYEVYAAGSENGSYTKLYQTTGLRFVHGGAKPGKEYWYKVVALDDTGLASVQSAAVSVTVPDATMEPPMAGLCWNGSGKPMIVWNAVAGADHYEVYCWSAGNPGGVCIARTTGVQFTHTNASAGEGYVYRVRAVNSSTGIGAYSDPVVIR